jgi:hypothetical protein
MGVIDEPMFLVFTTDNGLEDLSSSLFLENLAMEWCRLFLENLTMEWCR